MLNDHHRHNEALSSGEPKPIFSNASVSCGDFEFEGTIWAKHITMEQTCQNDDFGLSEEILKKRLTMP